jgi:glycosyltransferase involved in cell wall biosynthesis
VPRPLLLYVVPNDSYFYSHRMPMVRAAFDAGFAVGLVTGSTVRRAEIEAAGIRVVPCLIDPGSAGIFTVLRSILDLTRIYRRESPALVHHITLKAIACGAVAAWLGRVPACVNAFAGLGHLFTATDARTQIRRTIFRCVLRFFVRRPGCVTLVQNADDGARLAALGLADPARTVLIPGSGVDTERFCPLPLPPPDDDGKIICVFAGRMIGIKGLEPLRAAFALLAIRLPSLTLWLCGAPDPNNPGSWRAQDLEDWAAHAPNVVWKTHQDDMRTIWARAHLAVQPSVGGEGVPKSLLEAAACARAIVATDTPGCRDVVEPEANGLLVPPGDARALADALEDAARDPDRLRRWGERSCALVFERDFSAQAVTARTRALYESLRSG